MLNMANTGVTGLQPLTHSHIHSLTILMLSWFLFLKQDETLSPLMAPFIFQSSLSLFSKFPETALLCVQAIPGNSPSNFNGCLKVLPYLLCLLCHVRSVSSCWFYDHCESPVCTGFKIQNSTFNQNKWLCHALRITNSPGSLSQSLGQRRKEGWM